MRRPALAAVLIAGALAAGCQTDEIEVDAADEATAQLFFERCSGCHTLAAASSRGSKPEGQIESHERTNGPSFDARKVSADDTLFAIRNGGFSGAIMPANIVVGEDAERLAEFVEKYSGERVEADTEAPTPDVGG